MADANAKREDAAEVIEYAMNVILQATTNTANVKYTKSRLCLYIISDLRG
jgi:hypothetical protein